MRNRRRWSTLGPLLCLTVAVHLSFFVLHAMKDKRIAGEHGVRIARLEAVLLRSSTMEVTLKKELSATTEARLSLEVRLSPETASTTEVSVEKKKKKKK